MMCCRTPILLHVLHEPIEYDVKQLAPIWLTKQLFGRNVEALCRDLRCMFGSSSPKSTVCEFLIMCFKLKSIKSSLAGRAQHNWTTKQLQFRQMELRRVACHLDSHWDVKCCAAAELPLWLLLNANFQTMRSGEGWK